MKLGRSPGNTYASSTMKCPPAAATVVILIHLLLSARAIEGVAIPSRRTKLMRGS